MINVILQCLRDAHRLAQRFGPYVAIEILLPGGTLVALLLFLFRQWRAPAAGGGASPLADADAALVAIGRDVLDLVPLRVSALLARSRPERDGLEPFAMAPD
jgi:hypothetical protein